MSGFSSTPPASLTPGILRTPMGTAAELPVNIFLDRVLPSLAEGVEIKGTDERLMRTGKKSSSRKPITLDGRWRGFAQDPTKMKAARAFNHFPDAVSAILKAGRSKSSTPCPSIYFRNDPSYAEDVGDREGSMPDAYLLSNERVIWSNVIAFGQYINTGTERDRENNVRKVVTSMANCMYRDPRRRFTFAFTIEDTNMRLWYSNRSQIVVSEPFNFITNREPMIHFFLALAYAQPCQLGWDQTMTPLEDGRNFDIRVDLLDGTQQIYRTLQLLSQPRLQDLLGKGTRVWKAILLDNGKVCGEPVALKDAWVDADRKCEGAVLSKIHALPINTETHRHVGLERAFPTAICHGYVFVDMHRTHLDYIRCLSHTDDFTDEEPALVLLPGTQSPVLQETSAELADTRVSRYTVHYRIVFKEVGKPLAQEQSITLIFKMLAQVAYTLHHLHQCGWVHRDISVANILILGERGALIDVEYATKMGQCMERRMGTPGFMPNEVNHQSYLLRSAVHHSPERPKAPDDMLSMEDVKRRLWPREGEKRVKRIVVLPELSPEPPFRYNALHDLESLWWVAVYFILKRRVVNERQDPPSVEDIKALAEQCRRARRLFDICQNRVATVTVAGVFVEHALILDPVVRPGAILLDRLRNTLRAAYIQQAADTESIALIPDIHTAFMHTFMDIADADLDHIMLLPLPPLNNRGEVIIPQAPAIVTQDPKPVTQGTKRSFEADVGPDAVPAAEEPPKKQAKLADKALPGEKPLGRTRPYLPRKAKPPRK